MGDLVSAIITTHNRKKLVRQAIESVLSQTYENMECIVIDDASTDGTENYLKNYIDEARIHYIYIAPSESKGGNHARNIGINEANGKYVAFLDDDDEWFPEKTEKQMAIIRENPKAGYVYCGRIYEKNEDISSRWGEQITDVEKYKSGNLSKEVLIHIIATTSTIIVLRQLLLDICCFDEKLKYWQEYEMSIRLLQKTHVGIVRENLVLYRIVESGRLSNKLKGWEEAVKYIYKKHSGLYKILNPREIAKRDLYYCIDGINRAKGARKYWYILKYCAIILCSPQIFREAKQKYKKLRRG